MLIWKKDPILLSENMVLTSLQEGKRLNVKERAPEEDDTLYEPLDYVYEGKRLNVKEST